MNNLDEFTSYKLTGDTFYYDASPDNLMHLLGALNKSREDVGISINFHCSNFENIDFISKIQQLVGVRIIGNGCNLEPIEKLSELKNLILEGVKKPNLNFSNMKCLTQIRADWVSSMVNIFEATQLEHLALWGYKSKSKDFTELVNLKNLKTLNLTKGNVESLNGVDSLSSLRSIEFNYLRNVKDLSLLANLKGLIDVEIESSPKINNAEVLFNLKQLKVLKLINAGSLKGVKGIENCSALTFLSLHKTVIEDGDLSPLTKLTRLEDLKLDNKKHHSHKLAEIEDILNI